MAEFLDDVYMEDALNQVCIYWAPGPGGNEGQKTFLAPIEIACRWEDSTEQFLDRRTGNPETSRALVYVDRDLEELGVLWLPPNSTDLGPGQAKSQLTSQTEPFSNAKAYEIRRLDKKPNFDADEFARIAYL